MNTFPAPTPTAPVQTPRRRRRWPWIILAVVGGLTFLGYVGRANDPTRAEVAAADPGYASTSGDADVEIMAIDYAWSEDLREACDDYNDVRDVPNIDNFVVSKFEEGYGQPLTAAGRAHLISLLHSC